MIDEMHFCQSFILQILRFKKMFWMFIDTLFDEQHFF